MTPTTRRVAIGCQGGGSHTAFTAGVLRRLIADGIRPVAWSGTSGGAICALLAWYGLLRDDPEQAREGLEAFWQDMSTNDPLERLVSQGFLLAYRTTGQFLSPELSPYMFPARGQQQLKQAVERLVEFDRIPALLKPDTPRLLVSAVDVKSGEFDIFSDGEVTAQTILATTAVPTLFRAVKIGERAYWDGLFAQNPPIRNLAWERPDEIWIVQINPRTRASEPRSLADIRDRRNELSGNLSLEQELHPIETINKLIADGRLEGTEFSHITVRRIEMALELDSASKLNRSPDFISDLIDYGEERARAFLRGLDDI